MPATLQIAAPAPTGTDRATAALSVLVVLENELLRHGVVSMLRHVPSVGAVLTCGDAAEAAALLDGRGPDVLLCHGSEAAAAELVPAARARGARTLLLLRDLAVEALDEGVLLAADGFLMQAEATVALLQGAVDRLGDGDMPLPAPLARTLLTRLRRTPAPRTAYGVTLTPRERQVLGLLVEGLSNKQIARRLTLTEHGVKRHVTNLLAKLNCPNRTMAVALALRDGLVPPATTAHA
jgi:DNA-binding NarL/FixJ family response regulator